MEINKLKSLTILLFQEETLYYTSVIVHSMINPVIFRARVNFRYYFRPKSKSKPGSTQLLLQENPIKKVSLDIILSLLSILISLCK